MDRILRTVRLRNTQSHKIQARDNRIRVEGGNDAFVVVTGEVVLTMYWLDIGYSSRFILYLFNFVCPLKPI